MRNLILAAATAALSLTLTTSAFALNPQPEPPGRYHTMFVPANKLNIGSATSGAGAGRFSDADDNYCGTRVPGNIPHIGPVRGGGSFAGRVADYDDKYCGTRVPGHGPIRFQNVRGSLVNSHDAVMLNPQPLPPKMRGERNFTHY